ncbi:MAG: sugar transferase [Pseudomonadota bacterium]
MTKLPNAEAAVHFDKPPTASSRAYRKALKRGLDLALVLIALPVVLPLIVFLAVLVMLFTRNRPFYSQSRIGRDGKHFRMWKLRTMVSDADEQLEEYLLQNPNARLEWDSTQKLKDDPRITPFGRILRKTSLDELPQLLNVLNGTMSLVGPRPMMVSQKPDYDGQAYFALRPGITGLWQISDRNNCAFKDRVLHDEVYNQVLSLKTDVLILYRTVGVVMRATGH